MSGKGFDFRTRVARRVLGAPSAAVVLLLAWSCGGASKFSDREDENGGSANGGASSGSAGDTNEGGSVASGGAAGTSPSGGSAGNTTGGSGGTDSGGGGTSGGTDSNGGGGTNGGTDSNGGGGTSGASGASSGGGSGLGGASGTGGAIDERCPPRRPDGGACEPNGLVCRYNSASMCLCASPQPGTVCVPDPRCATLLDQAARIIIDAGAPGGNGGAVPIATQTCTCRAAAWSCSFP